MSKQYKKRKFIDFTKDELVSGTLTGKFFHNVIEGVVATEEFAVLVLEHDEWHPTEKKLAVYSRNKDNPYFSVRISTTSLNYEDMYSWLKAYNDESAFTEQISKIEEEIEKFLS